MDDALRHGSRVGGGRAAALRRNLLVGTQVALALALLVVSGLAVQSMLYVRRTDLGYDPRAILAWNVPLPADRYASPGGVARFASDAASALQAGPMVRGVAFTSGVPVLDVDQPRPMSGTLHDGDDPSNRAWASWYSVTPGFFDTMGLSVMAGRGFNDADRAGAEPVALLNRYAAERYFDTLPNAIGRRVVIHDAGLGERPVTIVGIVADTRDNSVLRTGPQVYVPLAQWPVTTLAGVVRADEPLALAADVRATMRRLDPEVPVSNLKPLSQVIDEEMSSSAIISGLFVSFAVLALVLATAGLFAVISFSVGQRRREIGLRLALGAPPGSVGRMVVASGLRVTLIGAAAGVLIGLALSNAAASVLLGISPRDPATFGAATALVVLVAVAACFSPAISAMRVDPARTLRTD
jgi:putative ABC transport system permease protein